MNQAIRNEIRHRGLFDILPMAELMSVAHRHLPISSSDSEGGEELLSVISDLLGSKQAVVGDVTTQPDGLLTVRSWD